MLLQPDAFEACFSAWAQALSEPLPREVIAIDGKTTRGSFDNKQGRGPLHLVSAWACQRGVALGQQCVKEKSNEITAIPLLPQCFRKFPPVGHFSSGGLMGIKAK